MSNHVPPMPNSQASTQPTEQQPQHAAPPEWQPQFGVPAEQRLVYESTPGSLPASDQQPPWLATNQRPRQPRQRSPWPFAFGGLVFGLTLGLVIGLFAIPAIGTGIASRAEAAAPSPFETALDTCDLADSSYATVGDDGASLELQTEGIEAVGMDGGDFTCVIEALDISDAAMSRIETTRALDGRQEASWGDFTASWTYHPDNGVNMLIERAPNDES